MIIANNLINKNTILFYKENIIDNMLFYLEKKRVFGNGATVPRTICRAYKT